MHLNTAIFSKYEGPSGNGLFPDYNNQTLFDAIVTMMTVALAFRK